MASFTLLLPFMLYGIGGEQEERSASHGDFATFVTFYSLLHIFTWACPLSATGGCSVAALPAPATRPGNTLPAHN
jgi:hypothetical protein